MTESNHQTISETSGEHDAALASRWHTQTILGGGDVPQHAALPVLSPSQADLDAWRDAPSGTASA